MAHPEVRLVAGVQEWTLGGTPRIIPAGHVVLAVSGNRSRTVMLNGRATRLSSGQQGLIPLDLTRSTGYHRLEVDGTVFWFGTEDAKLGLDGIEAMLADLRTLGTGWSGQALFSDGTGLRDVHVLYAWLDQWADAALVAVEAILTSPRAVTRNSQALTRRGGPSVLLSPTLRLLRSAPQRYLSASPTGLIPVGNKWYDPLRVVMRRRTSSLDTIANHRAIRLLGWLAKLSREVLDDQPDPSTRARCRLWFSRAQTLQRRPLAQTLKAGQGGAAAPRQAEETTEARYRTSYESSRDLHRQFGWWANRTPLPRFSYVERADTIYQAYAASRIARSLGLTQTAEVLGSVPLAFIGPEFDLYYDTRCPPEVLRSWRAHSNRPDASRPDLLLHERSTGRVAILDAKYRLGPDGGASEDSRKEVAAYLSLYGLRAVTILYPGAGQESSIVRAKGHAIVELPLAPALPESAIVAALPDILATLEYPPY